MLLSGLSSSGGGFRPPVGGESADSVEPGDGRESKGQEGACSRDSKEHCEVGLAGAGLRDGEAVWRLGDVKDNVDLSLFQGDFRGHFRA